MTTIDEIKAIYHATTARTIQKDLARAIALLKTLGTEAEREKAAVYMDGLSQMRSEWAAERKAREGGEKTGSSS